ncbi:MAG TPA: tetratricopeptide repeat protein [Candidatus Binataceae bacterium]
MNDEARREFIGLAAHEPVALARAALVIAKEEYPALEVDLYLERLAELGREAARWMGTAANTVEQVQALSRLLFEHHHFAGNQTSYGDPRNSFLNEVLERKVGIPISLSVVYIEVGRRAGLKLEGVSFPGHFLVKATDDRGELIIDPFNQGTILNLEQLRTLLNQVYGQPVELHPSMLRAATSRQILSRMLRNLKNVYVAASDWMRAVAALDRILILEPRSLDELLERAKLNETMECFQAALDDLQSFLSIAPDHPIAEAAREGVMRLARQVSRIS